MRCDEFKALMSTQLDMELTPDEAGRLEAHLATCEACRRDFARLRQTVGLLRTLEPVAPPPDLLRTVRERVAVTPHRPVAWVSLPWVRLALAAGVMVVLTLYGIRALYPMRSGLEQATAASVPAGSSCPPVPAMPAQDRLASPPCKLDAMCAENEVKAGAEEAGAEALERAKVTVAGDARKAEADRFDKDVGADRGRAEAPAVPAAKAPASLVSAASAPAAAPVMEPVMKAAMTGGGAAAAKPQSVAGPAMVREVTLQVDDPDEAVRLIQASAAWVRQEAPPAQNLGFTAASTGGAGKEKQPQGRRETVVVVASLSRVRADQLIARLGPPPSDVKRREERRLRAADALASSKLAGHAGPASDESVPCEAKSSEAYHASASPAPEQPADEASVTIRFVLQRRPAKQ